MLSKKNLNFDYKEWYSFIRSNQLISYYQNGNRYFLFAISGKICNISESQLSFIAFLSSIMVGVAIRVGIDHIRKNSIIKKKYNCLLTKLSRFNRGGALHYEQDLQDKGYLSLRLTVHLFSALLRQELNSRENLTKNILQKCLEQGNYYKVTSPILAAVIVKSMDFKKTDSTRIISYDSAIFALWHSFKIAAPALFKGFDKLAANTGMQFLLKESPTIAAIMAGIRLGFQLKLSLFTNGITPFLYYLLNIFVQWRITFKTAVLLRGSFFIDCSDYFEIVPSYQIPQSAKALNGLPDSQISVVPSKPNRHQIFVSTAPGTNLYYESTKPLSISTLDGIIKEGQNLKGDRVIYWKNLGKKNLLTESKFLPLSERTRTLADLKNMDFSNALESTEKIRTYLERSQVIVDSWDESLE